MSVTHPDQVRELLSTVYRLTADGALPMPESTHYPLAEAATAIRVMSAAEHTGKLILDIPHTGTQQRGAAARSRSRSSAPTAPTSSPAAWVASGCSWPRRWPRRAAGRIVLSSRSAAQPQGAGDNRTHPGDRGRHRGGVRRHRRRGHRRAVGGGGNRHRASAARCAARGRGGRGRHAGQHHRRADRARLGAEGLRRLEPAPGHRRRSRWTGSARSPRRPRCWARPVRAPTPRPTAGWTPSPTGGGLRACRPPRSPGAPGPRSAARTALAEGGDAADRSRRGRLRVRGAAAPRPRLHRLCPDHRSTVADRLRATQPVRAKCSKSAGQSRSDTSKFRAELQRAAAGRVARPAAASGLRADQPDPASHRRPGPSARPSTAWTRWATSNCAPASRPKPGSASAPPTSPPFGAWRITCATSWRRKTPQRLRK